MELPFFQWLAQNCLQIAVLAIIMRLFLRLYKIYETHKLLSQIPGPDISFTMLLAISVLRKRPKIETLNFILGLSRVFSKSGIFRVWNVYKPFVAVSTPELAEIVLTREEFMERATEYRFLSLLSINESSTLIISNTQEWRKRRKLMNPAFHIRIIERYIDVFNKHAARFVEEVKQRDPMQPIDIFPEMKMCTMGIICESAMGVDLKSRKENDVEFIDAFHTCMKLCAQRIYRPWLYTDIVFKSLPIGRRLQKNMDIVNQMTRKLIAQTKSRILSDPTIKKQIEENFVEGAKQRQVCLIDMLVYLHLYGEERLSEDEILGEVNLFIFAGFDTCSVTLSWALYLIGNDPRVQQAIHEELDTVLENDRDRPISIDDIFNMKYLSCVFKETLRLYPPGSILYRYIIKKDAQLNGYTIPKGTRCGVLVKAIHMNSGYFPKPESFLPERFLYNETRHPFAYIPFSAGPKNCIGQKFAHLQAMTILASVLRNFSVKSTTTRDKVREAMYVTTMPTDPMNVYLTSRLT